MYHNLGKNSSILKAILAIGRTLSLDIVLEGVETEEQVQFLRKESGSLIFQGYYFAKPMTSAELVDWLAQRYPILKAPNHKKINTKGCFI